VDPPPADDVAADGLAAVVAALDAEVAAEVALVTVSLPAESSLLLQALRPTSATVVRAVRDNVDRVERERVTAGRYRQPCCEAVG
jgi:hypothetical protein